LLQVLKELVVESTGAIALLAGKSFLVDSTSIALEALWEVCNIFNWSFLDIHVVILWLNDQALDVLLFTKVILLLTFGFNHNFGATLSVSGDCLGLRGTLLGVDHSSDLLESGNRLMLNLNSSLLLRPEHLTSILKSSKPNFRKDLQPKMILSTQRLQFHQYHLASAF
jgi:hypothetical protein